MESLKARNESHLDNKPTAPVLANVIPVVENLREIDRSESSLHSNIQCVWEQRRNCLP